LQQLTNKLRLITANGNVIEVFSAIWFTFKFLCYFRSWPLNFLKIWFTCVFFWCFANVAKKSEKFVTKVSSLETVNFANLPMKSSWSRKLKDLFRHNFPLRFYELQRWHWPKWLMMMMMSSSDASRNLLEH
jgi:hypothetical protein